MFIDISSNIIVEIINEQLFYSSSPEEIQAMLIQFCQEHTLTEYMIVSDESGKRIITRYIFRNGHLYTQNKTINDTLEYENILYYKI